MRLLTTLADRAFARLARWPIIGALALAFVVLNVVILSSVTRFEAVSAGLPLLEVPSLAPPAEIEATARAYPAEAARIYLTQIQPLDILYPLAAGLTFGSTLYLLATARYGAASPWRALSLLGPAMTLSDYLENIGVFALLQTAGDPLPGAALLIRAASLAKFGVGIPALLSVLALGIALLSRRLARGARPGPPKAFP